MFGIGKVLTPLINHILSLIFICVWIHYRILVVCKQLIIHLIIHISRSLNFNQIHFSFLMAIFKRICILIRLRNRLLNIRESPSISQLFCILLLLRFPHHILRPLKLRKEISITGIHGDPFLLFLFFFGGLILLNHLIWIYLLSICVPSLVSIKEPLSVRSSISILLSLWRFKSFRSLPLEPFVKLDDLLGTNNLTGINNRLLNAVNI